jgi:predicted DNA-binding transcriptional regulator AlpA
VIFPDLADLVRAAPIEELPRLAGRLREAELLVDLRLRAWMPEASLRPPQPAEPTGNISAEEAAQRLGVSRSWIYKNAKALPFVLRIGRRIVCSPAVLARWSAARRRD